MKNFRYFLLASFLILACKSEVQKKVSLIETELNGLKSIEEKKNYLEKIFEDDQAVRETDDSAILLKFGPESKEYKEIQKKQWDQDFINLLKIEAFLSKFGHPKRNEVGEIAAITPWTVIHHAQGIEIREKYFKILYQAYLDGHIDDSAMSMYLGRWYQMIHKTRFTMKSPFKPEDEINELIKVLKIKTNGKIEKRV